MKSGPVRELPLPERLVVGVDERGMSDDAVLSALAVGERLGARVELVHAVRVPVLEWMTSEPGHGGAAMGRALEAAQVRVDTHMRERLGPALRVGLRVDVRPGTPAEVLLAAAPGSGAGMIFLGPHERRGLFDFGSTARAVLARGTQPVWIQTRPPRHVARILAGVDLSADSVRALSLACRLAGPLGASVRAVHFFDVAALYAASTPDPLGYAPAIAVPAERAKASEEFDRVLSSVDWGGVEHAVEFREGPAAEGLLELAESSDLVVVGTHGRTGLAAAVLGGVAHSVLKISAVPVLAVPNAKRRFRI
jgi:nucleotide-binding universal stress UspA family protein